MHCHANKHTPQARTLDGRRARRQADAGAHEHRQMQARTHTYRQSRPAGGYAHRQRQAPRRLLTRAHSNTLNRARRYILTVFLVFPLLPFSRLVGFLAPPPPPPPAADGDDGESDGDDEEEGAADSAGDGRSYWRRPAIGREDGDA